MARLGEIIRWIGIHLELLGSAVSRTYRRARAWLLHRDQLVASSERKFRALLEAAPDAMVIVDWHGHITLVNAQAERLFGWQRHEIVGRNIRELIPTRFRGPHSEHFRHYVRDPVPRPMGTNIDLFGRRKDG